MNPIFEEILKVKLTLNYRVTNNLILTCVFVQFVMPRNEVERRTMWISVWHSDMFGRNDFLGEVMMPMAGQVFDDPSAKWYALQDRVRSCE